MSKMIQIRDVPEPVHRKLKTRAAQAGQSLSEYLLSELRIVAERPTFDEMMSRLSHRTPVELPGGSAAAVRAERDSR